MVSFWRTRLRNIVQLSSARSPITTNGLYCTMIPVSCHEILFQECQTSVISTQIVLNLPWSWDVRSSQSRTNCILPGKTIKNLCWALWKWYSATLQHTELWQNISLPCQVSLLVNENRQGAEGGGEGWLLKTVISFRGSLGQLRSLTTLIFVVWAHVLGQAK